MNRSSARSTRRPKISATDHTLVVVSFYDRRTVDHLITLLQSLTDYDAGEPFDVCVVVNRTTEKLLTPPPLKLKVRVLNRNNVGMNIGAWDHGWRLNPGYGNYLFLQDECYVIRDGWLSAYKMKFSDQNFGLIGECLNPSWGQSWSEIRRGEGQVTLPEHEINGRKVNRVDFYLDFLRRHGVAAGTTGHHLRSLVWFVRADVLEKINGFPIGLNYGECIAAEIAVSKKIESLGMQVTQVNALPFYYFRHVEWNQDRPGGPFTNKPVLISRLRALESMIDSPTWRFIFRILRNRVRSFSMLRLRNRSRQANH